jgi:putative nucleotidyltransferase with HDIG domain
MTRISLPEWPWQAVRRLAGERGVRLWPVGGAVRDAVLGRPIHDWDFAVERDALGLARAVADALGGDFYPLDAERDTGRAIFTTESGARLELDFAALRGDTLEADLLARDFTVNALALGEDGAVLDPTGGLADLEARRVRAANECTFQDDPLRLLRAVRIEAELGFAIEPQTAAWLLRDASLLTQPSAERVRDEFMRLLALPGVAISLRRLDEFGLLVHVIPELETLKGVEQSPPHYLDVWQHTLATVDALEGVIAAVCSNDFSRLSKADVPPAAWGDVARVLGQFAGDVCAHLAVEVSGGRDRALLLRLAALLHDVGKPKTHSQDEDGRIHFYNHELVGTSMAAARIERLRFSRDEVERVRVLVGQHLRPAFLAQGGPLTRRAVYRYFRATACAGVDVVLLALADNLAIWGPRLEEAHWARRLDVAETLLTHWFERYEETVEPPPLVTGGELVAALGLEPGPRIGGLLRTLQEAQAAGEVQTREEALALMRRILGGKEFPDDES